MLHIPSKGYAYVPAGAKLYLRPSMNSPEDVASWPTRIQRKPFPLSGDIKKVGRETYVLFGTWGGVTAIRLDDVEWKKEPTMESSKASPSRVASRYVQAKPRLVKGPQSEFSRGTSPIG